MGGGFTREENVSLLDPARGGCEKGGLLFLDFNNSPSVYGKCKSSPVIHS